MLRASYRARTKRPGTFPCCTSWHDSQDCTITIQGSIAYWSILVDSPSYFHFQPHPHPTSNMPSTLRTATAAAILLSSVFQFTSATPSPTPAAAAAAATSSISMNAYTYIGCFSSSTPMKDQGSYTYQTPGYCQPICYQLSDGAMGLTGGSNCYCGDSLPAKSDLVDDSYCNATCNGYDTEYCRSCRCQKIDRTVD